MQNARSVTYSECQVQQWDGRSTRLETFCNRSLYRQGKDDEEAIDDVGWYGQVGGVVQGV